MANKSILLYLKWITNRTYCIAQGTLLSIMWQPGGEGSEGRMHTCTCVAESLRCSPKLIGCSAV